MDKKLIVSLGAVLLIIASGSIYWAMRPKSEIGTVGNKPDEAATTTSKQNDNNRKSLNELIALNIPQKCTYSLVENNNNSNGEIYIAEGKVRANFTATAESITINSHMIIENLVTYIWSDEQKTGIKMTIDPDSKEKLSTEDANNQGFDANRKIDYKCTVWVPDPSLFTIPATVTFSEFDALMKPKEGSETGVSNSQQCAGCSYLTGEEKDTCLDALNCN